MLALACVVAVGGVSAGRGAGQTRNHLVAAAELARDLYLHLEEGRPEPARKTLAAMQTRTRAARGQTAGIAWRAGSRVPVLGQNLAAIAEVAAALDDLAHDGLPRLVEVARDLDPAQLAPRDGQLDLTPLQRTAPGIAAASQAATRARDRVAAISTSGLLPPVKSAIVHLGRELDQAAAGIGAAARTAALAPAMLGAEERRTYLVLFQNNAEVRATGGIPAAFMVIEANRGALRILHQGTAAMDLQSFARPVLPLSAAMRQLYTDRPATYPANVNLTPHFPTAAGLAREMYRHRSGRPVDGVIATDPVALSYLLRATGPVPDGRGGKLTTEDAVRVLLSDVYARFSSNEGQDAYFADVASATFEALLGGGTDVRAAVRELVRAAGERRILVWSAHPAEQRLLEETVLGGDLPAEDGDRPVVGVFLNDGGGAKLGYYLTQSAQLSTVECRPDGRRELRLRVTLGSTAPASGLPPSVLGLGLAGDPYTIRTNVSFVSPAGGAVVDARLDGESAPLGTGVERGRAVGILTVDLAPGANRSIEVTVLTGVLAREGPIQPALRMTPTVNPWKTSVSALTCPTSG